MKRAFSLLFLCICLCGCAHEFTPQHMKLVDRSIRATDVQREPAKYIGKTVMTGGVIAGVHNTGEGGVLEVVQFALGDDNVPRRGEEPEGRLLAATSEFFDTDTYSAGQLVTLIGEIKGQRSHTVDGVTYTFPVLTIKELHVWPSAAEEEFRVPSNFDPYYWGYPGNPYKDRPIGQPFKRYQ